MRVHALQVAYDDDEPVAERVDRVAALVAARTDADLVVLPELWAPTGFGYRRWAERAEPVDGPTFTAIAQAAAQAGAYVHGGSIIEGDGSTRWNTSALFSPEGARLATYRKIHRFGFGSGEPKLLAAGEDVVTADLAIDGGTLTVGLATCYDLRFPELFRRLLDAGATAFLVPAAWPAARVGAWTLLGRARAMENQALVVQVNTGGTHARTPMGGHSQVVAATGEILGETATDGEEVLVVDVDLSATAEARASFPVLADRRLS